jgi:type IV secretion system protein VirD4
MLGTWRISDYTPEYRETSGVGKRKLLTMDEVLRLPIEKALVIIRGQKVLKVDKFDYSSHPESKKLISCKASEYIPNWKPSDTIKEFDYSPFAKPPEKSTNKKDKPQKPPSGKSDNKTNNPNNTDYVSADKNSILS